MDAINPVCKGCRYHEVLMCDADMLASYCILYRDWVSDNWDRCPDRETTWEI